MTFPIGDLSMKVGSTRVARGEGAFTVRGQIAAAFFSCGKIVANSRPDYRSFQCKTQRIKSTCRPACIEVETASLLRASGISQAQQQLFTKYASVHRIFPETRWLLLGTRENEILN